MTEQTQDPWDGAETQKPEEQKPEEAPPKKRKKTRTEVVIESDRIADFIHVAKSPDGSVLGVFRRKWVEDEKSPTGQTPIDVQILDCSLEIEYVVDTPDGKLIHCVVHKGHGIERAIMAAEVLEECKKLNAWGTRVALCNWNIDDDTTRRLLKTWLLQQDGARRIVYNPGHSGYDSHHGVWLTDGHAIGADGRAHNHAVGASTGAIMCSDNREREFLIPAGGPVVQPFGLPFDTDWTTKVAEIPHVMSAMAQALRRNLGHHGGAIALGWLVAGLARDRLQATHLSFPILYLTGPKHCGKNTLGDALMKICGQGSMPFKPGKNTTIVGMRDVSCECANIPMWFDELRNDDECAQWVSFVRTMFDGSISVIGNKDRNGQRRTFIPRRPLMCTSQTVFGRDAEHSRYIVVELTPHSIVRGEFPAVKALTHKAHQAFWRLAAVRPYWIDQITWLQAHYQRLLAARLEGHHVQDRQIYCWSVACLGLALATIPDPVNTIGMATARDDVDPLGEDFISEVVKRMLHNQEVQHEDSAIQSFWSLVETLHAQGEISSDIWLKGSVDAKHGEISVGIWVDFLINVCRNKGRLGSAIEKRLLYTELASEDGWIAHSQNVRIGANFRRCTLFTLQSTSIPAWVKKIVIDNLPSSAVAMAERILDGQRSLFGDTQEAS